MALTNLSLIPNRDVKVSHLRVYTPIEVYFINNIYNYKTVSRSGVLSSEQLGGPFDSYSYTVKVYYIVETILYHHNKLFFNCTDILTFMTKSRATQKKTLYSI